MATDDVMRFFALWMLTHETADEGLKAAVLRGEESGPSGMEGGPDAFVDGLAAMVAAEKDKMKAELAAGAVERPSEDDQKIALQELRFEVAEMRGRMDALTGALETVVAKLGPAASAKG
jgi:hypothetical protein